MSNLFVRILNMSISASWIVLIVMILRLFLKKMPKGIVCILWGIVALRLLIPVFPESKLSLMPEENAISQKVAIVYESSNGAETIKTEITPTASPDTVDNTDSDDRIFRILVPVWLLGVVGMFGYNAVVYWIFRRRVSVSIPMEKNVFLCDNVDTPFVLGFFRPKIYIPSGIEESKLPFILAHERAHIERRDHWWKPLGFFLLSVHWFNPVLWVAYILLCRDIEQACDEKVVGTMGAEEKIGYSHTLVSCSVHRRMIWICPVAFGEVGIKARVKGVLSYKKPAFWIVAGSVAFCAVFAVCFLTNPEMRVHADMCIHQYRGEIVTAATCTREGVEQKTCAFCKDSYTVPIPVFAHTYDDGIMLTPATCVENGVLERHCIGCTAVITEFTPKTAHIPGAFTVTKEPTCAEAGERKSYCTQCQTVCAVEPVEKSQVHTLEEKVVRESTCTVPGEGVRSCTCCGYSEQVAYELAEHNFYKYRTDPSSCVSYGADIYVCKYCDAVKTVRHTELGEHSWFPNGFVDVCIFCRATRSSKSPPPYTVDEEDKLFSEPRFGQNKAGQTLGPISIYPDIP